MAKTSSLQRCLQAALILCVLGKIFLGNMSVFADKTASAGNSKLTHMPLGVPARAGQNINGPALVEYGALLFSSKALSRDGTIACSSCHEASQAYSGSTPVAVGIDGHTGVRHAPPLLNLYAARAFFWDGRAPTLEKQLLGPLEDKGEMSIEWASTLRKLERTPETQSLLKALHRRTLDKGLVIAALAAFLDSLVCGDSPFDRYYYGGDSSAISQDAKDGLLLFVRKGQCSTCHLITGISAPLTDYNFHSIGIGYQRGSYRDPGRYLATGNSEDIGLFKTPTLRDVSRRGYFMHDGSITSLRDVVEYYNKGGTLGAPNKDARLRPLFLSETEVTKIVAFLRTLDAPIISAKPH